MLIIRISVQRSVLDISDGTNNAAGNYEGFLHCGYNGTAGSLTMQRKLFILTYGYTKCWSVHPSGSS